LYVWDEERKPTQESVLNAKKQFDLIKKEVDADNPVVLWGIPVPEYGIVNGYKDEDYIVSTYRPLIGQPESQIHYNALMAPGGLMFKKFREPIAVNKNYAVLETIKRGYELGKGNVPHLGEYVVGPTAYDVLVKNLTEEEMDENSYHGTAYIMACLTEAKSAVLEYLIQNDSNVEPSLADAADLYGELSSVLRKCPMEFPMGTGEMLTEKCEKVAYGLLKQKCLN
jgi:hypothetical protein